MGHDSDSERRMVKATEWRACLVHRPPVAEMFSAAMAHHRSGRVAEAEAIYRNILAADPQHGPALHMLGVIAYQRDRCEDAVELIRRALASDPHQPHFHNSLGEVLRAKGELDAAEACYREAVRLHPGYAEAYNNLGIALGAQGRSDEAVAAFERAVSIAPQLAEGYMNLGNLFRDAGRMNEAAEAFRRAVEVRPGFVEARVNLGSGYLALDRAREALESFEAVARRRPDLVQAQLGVAAARNALGETEAAVGCYRKVLELDPDNADAHAGIGATLAEQGRLEEAVVACQAAIRLRPDDAKAYATTADIYARQGRLSAAEEACRSAIARDPQDADLRIQLGGVLRDQGRVNEAVAELREAVALSPESPRGHYVLGRALLLEGDVEGAVTCSRRALQLKSDYAEAHNNLGEALLTRGEGSTAVSCFERALELRPDFAVAYENLSQSRRFTRSDEGVVERIKDLIRRGNLSPADQACLHFALGKILDDWGQFDGAFGSFRRGNEIRRRGITFDPDTHQAWVSRIMATFDGGRVEAMGEAFGDPSELPVFVVGMLRSGTTLVEQILASHPRLHGAGELPYFHGVCTRRGRWLGTTTPYPEGVLDLSAAVAQELAQSYLARLRRDTSTAIRVTDKMPANFLYLGLIAILFPRARIVHCRREPFDTCLSIYFQDFTFADGNPYAWDLFEIGRYYRQYVRLMEHWRRVLPGRIHEVHYEALVNDPERISRGLIEHCGLEWDERCLEYYESRRPVHTASSWQVRQPVYRSSIGRWRRYEGHLDELRRGSAVPCPP